MHATAVAMSILTPHTSFCFTHNMGHLHIVSKGIHGSHASWKVMEFLVKFPASGIGICWDVDTMMRTPLVFVIHSYIYRTFFFQNIWQWYFVSFMHTVKPFNLAALKVGVLACKVILAPFILANYNHTIRNTVVISSNFGLRLIFAPFNFAVLFGSRNKGHANIKGFTVPPISCFVCIFCIH